MKLRYRPTASAILGLVGLGLVLTLLFLGRTRTELRPDFVTAAFPGFYTHISNFVVTVEIVLMIAFVWLLRGVGAVPFVCLFSLAIGLNLVIETFLGFLNTPDILDAAFGIFGVLCAAICTILIRRFGIAEIVEQQSST